MGLLATPGLALAQSDPSNGSPAGSVYKLPFDSGRGDAAPRKGDDPAGIASLFRSENNFGSSGRVPGAQGGNRKEKGGGPAVGVPSAETGETSEISSFVLIAIILAVGAGLGVLAGRALRGRGG